MEHASDYGALAPIVTGAGELMAAAIALYAIIAGRNPWSPDIPGLKNYAIRIFGAVAAFGIVGLFFASKQPGIKAFFLWFLLFSGCVGVLGALGYIFARLTMSFTCEGDKTVYVRGFRLNPQAQAVLEGRRDGLPPYFANIPTPPNEEEFFCRSGKSPVLIWTRSSYAASLVLMVASYFLAMVPLTWALAAGSIVLGMSGGPVP